MSGRYAVFESFVYDRLRNELTCSERPIELGPKPLELLALFLERPGELLTKDAILESLWPGVVVQEGNLAQQVYVLRKTLAASVNGDLIVTVPRRGYRFVAEVRLLDAPPGETNQNVDETSRSVSETNRTLGEPYRNAKGTSNLGAFSLAADWRPRPLRMALATVLVALTVTCVDLVYHPYSQTPSVSSSAISALPPDAQRAYRLARYFYNQPPWKDMRRARDGFREVIRLAPRSPLGYAGLADVEFRMAEYDPAAPTKATGDIGRAFALQALRLGPESAEAHTSYGCWLDWFGSSPRAAAREFERAIALDPTRAEPHLWYGTRAMYEGEFARSIAQLKEASRLDPTSFLVWRTLGMAYYYSQHYREAIPQFQQAIALYPGSDVSRLHIALALEQTGQARRALPILEHLTTREFNKVQLRAWIAYCRAKQGEQNEAASEADRIARSPERKLVAPNSLAAVYVAAGRTRAAVALLQAAKLDDMTMWTKPESAAMVPRFDPRLAMVYRDGHLQDAR
jgi:DNA-binding winged helix-turn-helix (wHTH) protein/tetratricopeptide (TPR) repeat protein